VGTARAGASGFTVIALTADRQGVDNFASLPTRHFKAALVPGCTSEQFATKSERQAARMAARCSSVSCLAARVCEMPTRRRTESREDLNMQKPSRTCPSWRFTENRDLPICHHALRSTTIRPATENTSGMRRLTRTMASPRSRSSRIRLKTSATCRTLMAAVGSSNGLGVAESGTGNGACLTPASGTCGSPDRAAASRTTSIGSEKPVRAPTCATSARGQAAASGAGTRSNHNGFASASSPSATQRASPCNPQGLLLRRSPSPGRGRLPS